MAYIKNYLHMFITGNVQKKSMLLIYAFILYIYRYTHTNIYMNSEIDREKEREKWNFLELISISSPTQK